MKKLFVFLIPMLIGTGLLTSAFAQSPEKISYQAVVRDGNNSLVSSVTVTMKISILQSSSSGTIVYVETHKPTTNSNGLASVEIGAGTAENGNFTAIEWENGPYFIKTETDPAGGTNYTITGTSQLLSVPYALHAKTAETIKGGISETDPLFMESIAGGITESDTSIWNNKLESYTETDPSVPSGTTPGEMQYWNGAEWITVPAGGDGQILSFSNGQPVWVTVSGVTVKDLTDAYNPTTGKIWMDRNLGASQVAISSTDEAAYGDLYQWGRGTDGHEKRTSGTTTTLSSSNTPGHGDFIHSNTANNYDWRSPQNDNLWQGVNGTNNPCPSGYRLPTDIEWEAEVQSWSSKDASGAFASPLKLVMAGIRYTNGSFDYVGSAGYYWSSTVSSTFSGMISFNNFNYGPNGFVRSRGFSVRCIKD